jgi:tRNA uridine 5-carboxymethylaminomethyl modification enzyme
LDLEGALSHLAAEVVEQLEVMSKYEGYIKREQQDIERMRSMESQVIPNWVDYERIPALRHESREKLKRIRPLSIGQASRIPGVNPADISILSIVLKRGRQ